MKNERIEFRSTPQEKDLFFLASQLADLKMSAFVRKAATDAAKEVVQEHERIQLSDQDRDLFLKALESPPSPTAKLKEAFKHYKKNK